MFSTMAQRLQELMVLFFLAIFSKAVAGLKPYTRANLMPDAANNNYCLSWRLAVEANNVRGWRTVPAQCLRYIEAYMIGGQYDRDLEFITQQIWSYVSGIVPSSDGWMPGFLTLMTLASPMSFTIRERDMGTCDPYDPAGFKAWALMGGCPAIPAVLRLFLDLVEGGFKVFLVTGRDQESLGQATADNLHNQGFIGYERLILRTASYKGQSAVKYKSDIRKQLVEEGYRIWGNVGDQWSDLQGEFLGNRTFKLPNPMYFVP
ncbi:hypothetical protein GH714_019791 [Hevea brasiliensis]|uniref:Acid phosphatase n=1 Tax=Hevea brasiliensis TaxID=3981 RepID=A0A6A6LYV1_HEVBR|nr:hypothetical protein GH714_019791 [Hevea brasiliensis]